MEVKKIVLGALILLLFLANCSSEQTEVAVKPVAEEPEEQIDAELQQYQELFRLKDSLLFSQGFNHCDTAQLRVLTSSDFEFYHDQSGVTTSQDAFIQGIAGLCHMSYKPTRELAPNSMTINLLRNNGEIYGVIQSGEHRFYGEEEGKPKYLTSTAQFTHLWIMEDDAWKLKRVLSYNHIPADQ